MAFTAKKIVLLSATTITIIVIVAAVGFSLNASSEGTPTPSTTPTPAGSTPTPTQNQSAIITFTVKPTIVENETYWRDNGKLLETRFSVDAQITWDKSPTLDTTK